MDSEHNEIEVALRILDFECDPSEITEEIGIVPTRTWRAGERINEKTNLQRKQNGWELSSGLSRHAEFNDHVSALINRIGSHLGRLAEVGNKYYCELSCAMYIYYPTEESTPWIHFDKGQVAIFKQLGAEIDFDLYLLPTA